MRQKTAKQIPEGFRAWSRRFSTYSPQDLLKGIQDAGASRDPDAVRALLLLEGRLFSEESYSNTFTGRMEEIYESIGNALLEIGLPGLPALIENISIGYGGTRTILTIKDMAEENPGHDGFLNAVPPMLEIIRNYRINPEFKPALIDDEESVEWKRDRIMLQAGFTENLSSLQLLETLGKMFTLDPRLTVTLPDLFDAMIANSPPFDKEYANAIQAISGSMPTLKVGQC